MQVALEQAVGWDRPWVLRQALGLRLNRSPLFSSFLKLAKQLLCRFVARRCRSAQPFLSSDFIAGYTLASPVHGGEHELSVSMALPSRSTKEIECLLVVHRHSLSVKVDLGKQRLRVGDAACRGKLAPMLRGGIVLSDAVAVDEPVAKSMTSIAIAFFGACSQLLDACLIRRTGADMTNG